MQAADGFLTEVRRAGVDSDYEAKVELADASGGLVLFRTNADVFHLQVATYDLLELAYDDLDKVQVAHEFAQVCRAVHHGEFEPARHGEIAVRVGDDHYVSLNPDRALAHRLGRFVRRLLGGDRD